MIMKEGKLAKWCMEEGKQMEHDVEQGERYTVGVLHEERKKWQMGNVGKATMVS